MHPDRQPDWEQIRREFPALAGCTYLNTATFGQTPRRGVEAVARHFERRNAYACSDFLEWFDDVDRMRASVASLIHAQPEDIAFVNTASAALALLMNGLEWRTGDRILALAGEFPNNLYFPAALSVLGVEFVETEWDQIESLLDERVRLVLMSTVNYATGFRPALEPLAAKLRDLGALFYVDGTQSVGALRFDVRTVQPDMLAVHAYKWMLSPNGAAFAYFAPHLRESLRPTVVGWRSDRGWRNVDQLQHGAPDFPDGAEKYEGGMVNFPSLYAMGEAVEMMLQIGPEEIEQRVLASAGKCSEILEEAGGEITYRGSQVMAARFEGVDAPTLAQGLKKDGVLVSARHGRLRVSTHFYNNSDDLGRLREALQRRISGART